MAHAENAELIERFEEFYRNYYRDAIGELAQKYPNEQRSLYIDYQDLYRFDPDLADDYKSQPGQLQQYAEEALRMYDLPVDVGLGRAHVRVKNLPEATDIRKIRARHRGRLIAVQGIVRKATDVRPKIQEAAFECLRCGTLTFIQQAGGDFQEPHECQGCERQGPFRINFDQSEFIDAQKLRVQESPEGLRGGETPQSIDIHIEDDITGKVTAGDHVRVTGVLHLEQQGNNQEKSPMFDVFMEGSSIVVEDEQFEEMDITEEDKKDIIELSQEPDIYDKMVGSIAPSIFGYEQEKLAMILQLFSGVTKHLPDGSRIRGDLHMLLIGDPGTGKCVKGDTKVTLADGTEVTIRELVESNLTDPKPIDDGVYQAVDFPVPSVDLDGTLTQKRATKVWKREAPDRMYRIQTASGSEIEVTPSHPLFVQSDGRFSARKAETLSEGQFIATPRHIPTTWDDTLSVDYRRSRANNAVRLSLPETWTPSLARLIGYIIAEGHVYRNDEHSGSVTITNNDREILDDVADGFERLGLTWSEREGRPDEQAREVVCSASEFVSFLENLEPAILNRSAEQHVPQALFSTSPEVKAAFLKAYVEAEGHVSTTQREITVSSMSRKLLEGVKSLLASIGIGAHLKPRHNESFRLRISGSDFSEYVEQVGFVTERKTVASQAFADVPENTNVDVIPDIGEQLQEIRTALALSQFDCGVPRSTYQHYERGDRNPSREALRSVITAFESRLDELYALKQNLQPEWESLKTARTDLNISQQAIADDVGVSQRTVSLHERNEVIADGGYVSGARAVINERIEDGIAVADEIHALKQLVEGDIRWEQIESIEIAEPDYEWVYDLEIEGTHNYLTNNIVSHNSAMLQYIRNIAPRSVYTSGKGSSSAGLCVTGDTRIHTENGFQEIRNLAIDEHPEPVTEETSALKAIGLQTFDRRTGVVDERASSHVWRMPEKPCRRIETAHGKSLTASENTPLLTCGEHGMEWVKISDIGPGDYVAIPKYRDFERTEIPVRKLLELTTEKVKLTDESVETIRAALCTEFGHLRGAATTLGLSEDFIYDSLRNRHVPLSKLDTMLDAVGMTREDITFDRLMIRHGDSITVPKTFDEELMYLLGLVFGDGDISLDRRRGNRGLIRLSNSDEEVLKRAATIFAEKFDKHPSIERQEGRVSCIRVNSATIARLFANAGMETPKANLELAPELTTAEHANAFLRGLMDADGAVSVRENGGSSILLSTISEGLAEQVQLMLETYGVRARRRERDRRGTYTLADGQTIESKHVQHFVEIYGSNIDRYAATIGFEVTPKQASLEKITNGATRRGETIPVGSALVATDGAGGAYHTNVTRGDNPGRERARAILEDVDLGHAEPLVREVVDASLCWDRVVEAADVGTKEVFDLTVPETHNFIGNGVVTHNTAAAVRDDFGDGQQWTLEAGALVLADKGIAAVDELDKMRSEDRSAMHEALEQQSYHPNSEILLADGRRVKIGEFVDSKMAANPDAVVDGINCEIISVDDTQVHSVDFESNKTTKHPVDRVSRHEAPDEFVRVRFSNGREVMVTPEHPMFVAGSDVETVEAQDISAGDFVPAPRKLPNSAAGVTLVDEPVQGNEKDVRLPESLTPDLAELLGLLVAEGHSYAGSSHEIGFSNQDQRLLERAATLARSTFAIESTDAVNAAGTVTKRWVSTKLYRWFEANFPEFMHTARDKRIPAKVLGASEEHIRRFLVGVFAGDGGVESEAMSFSTASEGLAEDYADALAKIGVGSRIHHDIAENSWKVYVMGDSIRQFVDAVVEPTDDRYDDAVAFADRSDATPRHHDVLPTDVAREIRSLRKLVGLNLTGKFRPTLDEGFGIRVETVQEEIAEIRDRVKVVEQELENATTLATIRTTINWSGRQLAERLDGVTTSTVHYAEAGGYDEQTREQLTNRAHATVQQALEEAEQRICELEAGCELRYYRVTDVEVVPNAGEYETAWVYDVTVEPTNTFVSQGVVLHNSISVSKAGINATLKSRCSLLGAANPKYGRFDPYEPIGEQIELEPALISRFDLIFTVTDKPDAEKDTELAEHILRTNYAGELHTHRTHTNSSNFTEQQVNEVTEEVAPVIDAELLRKYIAFSKRTCYPTMSDEAKQAIRDFYVDLRSKGADEDAPVPVTARKLEGLVRLSEASARVRLSDTVETEDAERVIELVRSCLQDIGVDPETGQFDADVVETGRSKTQRDRVKNIKNLIKEIEDEYEDGAPIDVVLDRAEEIGMDHSKAEHEIEKLKQKGEVYEPRTDHLRTT
ncbi:LAGLIDADG family homing endonuclease [Haladaptatus sp. QDMS2]|uniref:LAGLIDADG family homing endonuclease n=1 Tax=Haladaptatus sp. QDMS2 TaxID=3033391 RepID=UPI0023E81E7D|nr:LAGLIDADG family homing endonuclease [Haladaptatus sp. QDMS2]